MRTAAAVAVVFLWSCTCSGPAVPNCPPDTVACGSGWDTAWVDEADSVAADCELVLRSPVQTFRKVTSAEAAAQALLAHQPDPTR